MVHFNHRFSYSRSNQAFFMCHLKLSKGLMMSGAKMWNQIPMIQPYYQVCAGDMILELNRYCHCENVWFIAENCVDIWWRWSSRSSQITAVSILNTSCFHHRWEGKVSPQISTWESNLVLVPPKNFQIKKCSSFYSGLWMDKNRLLFSKLLWGDIGYINPGVCQCKTLALGKKHLPP